MRRLLVPLLSAVLIVAAVVAVLSYLAPDSQHATLTLTEVGGQVTITSPDGKSVDGVVGAVLAPRQRVATGSDAHAVLSDGDQTSIRLDASSSVLVKGQTGDEVSLELENGKLRATVRPGGGALRVSNQGREVFATDADFDVGVDASGTLETSVTRNKLLVSGMPGVAQVDANTRIIAPKSGDAVKVSINDDVSLKVDGFDRRTRADTQHVVGHTQPYARVRVTTKQGGPVDTTADAAGDFDAAVPLAEGENPLQVTATDALGRAAVPVDAVVTRDNSPPRFTGGQLSSGSGPPGTP